MGETKDMTQTPESMYGWRVEALENWIKGIKAEGKEVNMEAMCQAGHLDQYHYLGLDANDDIISLLQVNKESNILDVGSGIGGPGRYIAWKTGCSLHGVDIQDDLVVESNKVCEEVGIAEKCKFFTQDCSSDAFNVADKSFDGFYCILVFLHIPQAPRLASFEKISKSMKDSASFVIEDFVLNSPLTPDEKVLLEDTIGAVYVPTQEQYRKELEDVGFVDIEFEDLSAVWTKWTSTRRDRFLAHEEQHLAKHGKEHVEKMKKFYSAVPILFEGGHLGGCRITGRKPENTTLAKGREVVNAKKTNEITQAQVEEIMDSQKTV